jgi:hypothetical protein
MGAQFAGRACAAPPERRGGSLILRWDGTAPAALIAQIEACLAAGTGFAVLGAGPPSGRGADDALLARWWSATRGRLAGLCAGWAVLVPGADVNPGLLARDSVRDPALPFPVRTCADQAEAFVWLVSKLETLDAVPVRAAAARR